MCIEHSSVIREYIFFTRMHKTFIKIDQGLDSVHFDESISYKPHFLGNKLKMKNSAEKYNRNQRNFVINIQ